MGWLFALALGLQEKRRRAVITALLPIAAGHTAAIAGAIFLFRTIQSFLPIETLKWMVAIILFSLGVYRMFRASHPRGAGMRVGSGELLVWSFLMASAHGAGLMIIPVLLAHPMHGMKHTMAGMAMMPQPLSITTLALAVVVHTASMLIVAGILAVLFFEFYEKLGLRLLRHTWVNFDLLWAIALLVAGFVALLF
jgi:hypothetical protein